MRKIYLIALIVFIATILSGLCIQNHLEWYSTLNLPEWTLDRKLFRLIWSIIFVCSTISVTIIYAKKIQKQLIQKRKIAAYILLGNTITIVLWLFLFLTLHILNPAITIIPIVQLVSIIVAIYLIWPLSITSAALLIPYALISAYNIVLITTVISMN